MNNVGFNYSTMGLRNLGALGDIENERQWNQFAQNQKQAAAQSEAIGTMVGSVAGGVKGYYNKKRDAHAQGQAEQRRAYDDQAMKDYANARMAGQEPQQAEPFKPETFDFMAAIKKDLSDIGWIDP